jgi:Tfp pilus assembly protein PilF
MKAGRPAEAKEALRRAVGIDKDLRIAHFDLGILLTDEKSYDAAIQEFREAIRIDPKRSEAHYRLARLYQQLGRQAEAAPEFAMVKKLQEKSEEEAPVRLKHDQ